jgi:mannose-1-phosphate guanylyltransferase
MGTGGALRLTLPRLSGGPVLVMNGDSWVNADLGAFLADHRRAGRDLSLLCVEVPDCARFGRVECGPDGTVSRFVEKDPNHPGPGLINGGIYLFEPAALAALGAVKGESPSLETDFLATLPAGSIHCHIAHGAAFIDIGTPESLAGAEPFFADQAAD